MSAPSRLLAVAIAVFVTVLAALSLSGSASAAPGDYGGGATSPVVTTQTPTVGSQLGVSGQACAPNETLTLSLGQATLGTTVTDASGAYSTTVTLPSGVTGPQVITVKGSQGCFGTEALVISAASGGGNGGGNGSGSGSGSGGGGGSLASTGVAVAGIGAVGVVLLVGGGLMLLAGRRRKTFS